MKGSKLVQIIVITAVVGAFANSNAYAGKEAGNGGSGVVCFNSEDVAGRVRQVLLKNLKHPAYAQDPLADISLNTITNVTPLDLYEKSVRFNTSQSTLSEIVKEKVDQFSGAGTWVGDYVKAVFGKNPFPGSSWTIKPMSPLAIDDTNHAITFSPRCVLMQIARQDHLAGEIQFRMDQRLFQKMSVKEQAALILHELVYAVLADSNSINTREIVRLIAQLGGADDKAIHSRLYAITEHLDTRPDVDQAYSKEVSYSAEKRKAKIYNTIVNVGEVTLHESEDFTQDPADEESSAIRFNLFDEHFHLNGNEFRFIVRDPLCSDPLFGIADLGTKVVKRPDGKLIRALESVGCATARINGEYDINLEYCDGKSILSFTDKNGQNLQFKIGFRYGDSSSVIEFDPATARPIKGQLSQAAPIGHGLRAQKDTVLELTPEGVPLSAYLDPSSDLKSIGNLPIDFNQVVKFNTKGGIETAHLAKEYYLNGVLISAGAEVSLGENGAILAAKPVSGVYNGIVLAQDSQIAFYDNGQIRSFEPYQSESFQSLRNVPGSTVSFYPSGKLSSITPDQEVRINGWTYAAKSMLYFYEDGRVWQGRVSSTGGVYQGIRVRPGTEVNFFPNGAPSTLTTYGGTYRGIQVMAGTTAVFYSEGIPAVLTAFGGSYQGYQLATSADQVEGWSGWKRDWDKAVEQLGGNVLFYPNGKLRAALLASGNQVGAFKTRSTPAYFYSNGQVYGASYLPGQVAKFGSYQVTTSISKDDSGLTKSLAFYPNGTPIYGWFAQPANFGGFEWKKDFYLYPSGNLLWSTLAKTAVVNGRVYYAGNSLSFNSKGEIGNSEKTPNPWGVETDAFYKKLLDDKLIREKPKYMSIFSFEYQLF